MTERSTYEVKLICLNCWHEFCRTVTRGRRVETLTLGTYIVEDLFPGDAQPIKCPNCDTQMCVRKRQS